MNSRFATRRINGTFEPQTDAHIELRFWSKVTRADGCWLWQGGTDIWGYGTFSVRGRGVGAHRYSYELIRGSISDGLTIDHLCRVRACVNPDHMEAVTVRVNCLRGYGPTAMNARKQVCAHGHQFTADNTYVVKRTDGRTYRRCRACVIPKSIVRVRLWRIRQLERKNAKEARP